MNKTLTKPNSHSQQKTVKFKKQFKIEIHPKTHTPTFWESITPKQYFKRLDNNINKLIIKARKTFKIEEDIPV